MGKLHVFEEIDERIPKRGEVYLSMGTLLPLLSTVDPDEDDYRRTILRRLTDAEVEALVKRDDERARFVRDTAARMLAAMHAAPDWAERNHAADFREWPDCAVSLAESLATRLGL